MIERGPANIIKITTSGSPEHFGAVVYTHNDGTSTGYSDIFFAGSEEVSVDYMLLVGTFGTSKKGSLEIQGSSDLETWTKIDSVSKTTSASQMSATDQKSGFTGGYKFYRLVHKPESISTATCFGVIAFSNRV